MEYIAFDKEKSLLHYQDNLTSAFRRTTFRVKMFSINRESGFYQFEFTEESTLKIKQIFFPIQNTVLIFI
jgi:hypothetical protein